MQEVTILYHDRRSGEDLLEVIPRRAISLYREMESVGLIEIISIIPVVEVRK